MGCSDHLRTQLEFLKDKCSCSESVRCHLVSFQRDCLVQYSFLPNHQRVLRDQRRRLGPERWSRQQQHVSMSGVEWL